MKCGVWWNGDKIEVGLKLRKSDKTGQEICLFQVEVHLFVLKSTQTERTNPIDQDYPSIGVSLNSPFSVNTPPIHTMSSFAKRAEVTISTMVCINQARTLSLGRKVFTFFKILSFSFFLSRINLCSGVYQLLKQYCFASILLMTKTGTTLTTIILPNRFKFETGKYWDLEFSDFTRLEGKAWRKRPTMLSVKAQNGWYGW